MAGAIGVARAGECRVSAERDGVACVFGEAHRIDVAAAAPVEFILNHVEKATMQASDQRQRFEIDGPNLG